MGEATEAGIHFVAAGHYATETFGVRRLGEWLEARFGPSSTSLDRPSQSRLTFDRIPALRAGSHTI